MFQFRKNTLDSYIFYQIVHQNEYKLKNDLSDQIVVDIGAHIGSFTIASLQRNAKYVYAYEAHPENYALSKKNIEKTSGNASIENLAVIGNSNQNKKVGYSDLSFNTGKHSITPDILDNKYVDTILFDDIIKKVTSEHGNKIDILKIDCEGSEYPILYTSLCMCSINNIVGEYHNNVDPANIDKNSYLNYNGSGLVKFLQDAGFLAYHQYIKDAGLFFATRKLQKNPFLLDIGEDL